MKKTLLVLLENKEQYFRYKKEMPSFSDYEHVLCALTPFAVKICEDTGLSFIIPNDCFNAEEYYLAKEVSESLIKDLVERLNKYGVKMSKGMGFPMELGNYYYSPLYVLAGNYHFRAFLLDRLIDKVRPDKIIVFRTNADYFLVFRPDPLAGNVYTDLLLHSPFKSRVIILEYLYSGQSGTAKPSIKSSLKNKLKPLVLAVPTLRFLYDNITLIKHNITPTIFRIGRGGNKIKILAVGSLYNWKYVFSQPKAKKLFCVDAILGIDLTNFQAKKGFDISKEIAWDGQFINFNILELLRLQFNNIINSLDDFIKQHKRTVKKILNYDLVTFSILPFPKQNYLIHLARSMGKKIICYQHGEINLTEDSLYSESEELLYLDYYLSFGINVNSKYLPYVGQNLKGVTTVGSASLDKLLGNLQNTKTDEYILYATSKYLLNALPFVSNIGADDRLYDFQKKIFNYFESGTPELKDKKIFFKPNNTPVHGEVPFETRKIITTDQFKPFTELLIDAAVIILDGVGTTSMEAAITDKPLFILTNRANYYPEVKQLLAKRAVIADTPEELISRVKEYLTTGKYPADLRNREFVKAYGTHLDDGRSADRVIEFLISLRKS